MTRSMSRRAGGALAIAVLLLGGAACGDSSPEGDETEQTATEAVEPSDGDDATGDSDGGGGPEASDEDESPEGSPSAASPDFTPQNEQDCGPIFDGWRAVIGGGDVDCTTTVDVLTAFKDSDPRQDFTMPRQGAEVADGWNCDSIYHVRDGDDPLSYSMWCTKGSSTVLTTADSTPVMMGKYVSPERFETLEEGHSEAQIAFSSPSGKWQCGFMHTFDDDGNRIGEVGCHGTMPPDVIAPSPDGGGETTADSITLYLDHEPEIWVASDVNYFAGPTLEYGEVLYRYGFSCTVHESAGVTCVSPQHRFSASSTAVETG